MHITYRPIEVWPGELTPAHQRRRSQFSAPWGATVRLLEAELRELGARQTVMQVALDEKGFRVTDGRPRARSVAAHPGVILAFESKHGPLQYAVDTFTTFQDNVRAIALALEALRKVDRYGVTKHAEQYKGWKQLPGAGETGSVEQVRDELRRVARVGHGEVSDRHLVNLALRAAHPDTGGDADTFQRVLAAKLRLESSAS